MRSIIKSYPGRFFVVEDSTSANKEICAFIAIRPKFIDGSQFNEILSFRFDAFLKFPKRKIQCSPWLPKKRAWQVAAKTCLFIILLFRSRGVPVNHVYARSRKRLSRVSTLMVYNSRFKTTSRKQLKRASSLHEIAPFRQFYYEKIDLPEIVANDILRITFAKKDFHLAARLIFSRINV